jgi:hypothetical protein
MKGIVAERARRSRCDREHRSQDVVAMTERFRAELRIRRALKLLVLALQAVQRTTLDLGFSLVQRAENAHN